MLEPQSITVNGRTYTATPFNPLEAFNVFWQYENVTKNGFNKGEIMFRCIKQCTDPKGRHLSSSDDFHAVFSEHPEDMVGLCKEALAVLVLPFVGNLKDTSGKESGSTEP